MANFTPSARDLGHDLSPGRAVMNVTFPAPRHGTALSAISRIEAAGAKRSPQGQRANLLTYMHKFLETIRFSPCVTVAM